MNRPDRTTPTRPLLTVLVGLLTAALAATLAPMILAGPAAAAERTTHDAEGDGRLNSDLASVLVGHATKRVRIASRTHDPDVHADEMWHLVDTTGDATPDFLVFAVVHSEVDDHPAVSVRGIDAWPTRKNPYRVLRDGVDVGCSLHRGRLRDEGAFLKLKLGRGCFTTDGAMPARMRVSTFSTREDGRIADKAPAWRTYGRWVAAG